MELQEFTYGVEKLKMPMHQQAMHYLADSDDADDVVQEAFVKLWLKRADIPDIEKMRNLASVVVKNICLNVIRDRKPVLSINDNIDIQHHDDAQRHLEELENKQRLKQAVGLLTDKQRALIRMRSVENLSHAEIAKIVGTSESSVRGMICKARLALMNKLKDN